MVMRVFLHLSLLCFLLLGCLPDRADRQTTLDGRLLMTLMEQVGAGLEKMKPPEGGEGRIVNEAQNLWHYMRVSSSTRLTLLRSQYKSFFRTRETIIARFDHPGFGTMDITGVLEDMEMDTLVTSGNIKFTTTVESPSPGTAKAEIYPFERTLNDIVYPPSIYMLLPPAFAVPPGADIDRRKRYMKDPEAIEVFQRLIREMYVVGQREVRMTEESFD